MKSISELDEVVHAITLHGDNWKELPPRSLFRTEDTTLYYKKQDGSVMKVEKMAELILRKVEKREQKHLLKVGNRG